MPRPNFTKLTAKSRERGGGHGGGNTKQITISKFFATPKTVQNVRNYDAGPSTRRQDTNGGVVMEVDTVPKASPVRKRTSESPSEESKKKRARLSNKKKNTDNKEDSETNSRTTVHILESVDLVSTALDYFDLSTTTTAGILSQSTVNKLSSFNADFSDDSTSIHKGHQISIDDLKRASRLPSQDLGDNKCSGALSLNSTLDSDIGSDEDVSSEKQKPSRSASFLSKYAQSKTSSQAGKSDSKLSKGKQKTEKYTPLEQQVLDVKAKYPDVLLFVECGYKYRFFGDDAEIAAKELNIFARLDHNFMTASIPTHRLFVHVRRLVAKGYKVGVVKQMETAALKAAGDNRGAPFTRQLTSLYTKSTLIGEDVDPVCKSEGGSDLAPGASSSTYLMCIYEPDTEDDKKAKKHQIAIVAVQPSTGDIIYDVFEDTVARAELEMRIAHIQPAELLLPHTLSKRTEKLISHLVNISRCADDCMRLEHIDDTNFVSDTAFKGVTEFYGSSDGTKAGGDTSLVSGGKTCVSQTLSDILKLPKPIICCLHALLTYLKDFNLHKILKLASNMKEFSTKNDYMQLPACTVRNLELFQNVTNGKQHGSLLWVLDHTRTKFGARLLRQWVARPLMNSRAINERLDAVTELISSEAPVISRVKELLNKIPDVERALCTILHKKCSTSEFLSLCKALEVLYQEVKVHQVPGNNDLHSDLLRQMFEEFPDLLEGIGDWVGALNEKAAREGDKTVLFVDESQFPGVCECKQNIEQVLGELKDHRKEVRLALRLPALDYVTVLGTEFQIELKHAQTKWVPKKWIKLSSTKAVSRFHTPFIISACKRLNQLREQLVIESTQAWMTFLESVQDCYPQYKRAVEILAQLDCLLSLAQAARQDGFCRPSLKSDESAIEIEEGCHPIVSALLTEQEQYVPNDTHLQMSSQRCMVITGPNMGGKSSYIKQVALIAIMAQIGSYVPAQSATIGLLDAVYTRMGAFDELFQGRSTFMVELQEAAEIISKVTERSLVILDELGRGTSTHDGVAIAFATLQHFIQQVKCLCLFVTHYPPLTEIENMFPEYVGNFHMSFMLNEEVGQDSSEASELITFLYQLVPGMAARSYGLNVARLADIPNAIVNTARQKSRELESKIQQSRNEQESFQKICKAGEVEVITVINDLMKSSRTDLS